MKISIARSKVLNPSALVNKQDAPGMVENHANRMLKEAVQSFAKKYDPESEKRIYIRIQILELSEDEPKTEQPE